MTTAREVVKIIWAIDPFAEDKSFQRTALRVIRLILSKVNADIEPLYAKCDYPVTGAFWKVKGLRENTESAAQAELSALLGEARIEGLRPVTVLTDAGITLRETVEGLVAYAKKSEAQLIVTSTRARKGPRRWVGGSFSEALMSHSEVPLLVITPRWNQKLDLEHMVFFTDFSSNSEAAFIEVLKLARTMGSQLMLQTEMNRHADSVTADLAARWLSMANASGVEVTVFSRIKPGDSGEDQDHGLMALAVRRGGSVPKSMRVSRSPVWVVRARESMTG